MRANVNLQARKRRMLTGGNVLRFYVPYFSVIDLAPIKMGHFARRPWRVVVVVARPRARARDQYGFKHFHQYIFIVILFIFIRQKS